MSAIKSMRKQPVETLKMTYFGFERSAFVFYIAYRDLENFVPAAVGAGPGAPSAPTQKASTTGAEAASTIMVTLLTVYDINCTNKNTHNIDYTHACAQCHESTPSH
jgi:hypothetical protein